MNDHHYSLEEHLLRKRELCFDELLLKAIIAKYKPQSLIDLGAGIGWYCAEALRLGVHRAVGVDQTPDIRQISVHPILIVDLATQDLKIEPAFDLCLCLEVAQYIAPERAHKIVENCCANSDRVIFSAAHPGQPCPGAVNLRSFPWWINLFVLADYGLNAKHTLELRQSCRLPHLKTNVIVMERSAPCG